jgi:hypothetical protein
VTRRIALALAIHNHQPVGNFGWVFEDVFRRAYLPLVEALDRHRAVRLSLHYSGPLLEWLRIEHPELIEQLRDLVGRGQVEIMGGAYYEPVLVSLPERDRHGQLVRMADELEHLFGARPRGAWLAERVWEPDLPVALAESGYRWTILDDNHFRGASIREDAMWGAYITEDQGRLLRIFGTEQGLRYRIPFGTPEDVVDYLREHATEDGRRVGMMGDDGEKFGAWPGTYEHCWGSSRWVDRFFELLEANGDWLSTVTPSAWLERQAPVGRIYVPTASYIEMGEWALPADESNVLTALIKRASAERLPEARWLRGGFWRNYQVKYREINDLHKQMLRASAKVASMPPGADRDRAMDHLYRGQSNDCYWHGLFGGIYIVHMRLATYAHLIAAEDIADRWARAAGAASPASSSDEQAVPTDADRHAAGGRSPRWPVPLDTGAVAVPAAGSALVDTDMDGIDEAYLASEGQVVVVDVAEGAGVGSWDLRATRLALASSMRRRPEAYHQTLIEHERAAALEAAAALLAAAGAGEVSQVPRTIHDIVSVKEEGLSNRLVYDRHERRGGLVHLVLPSTTAADFAAATYVECGDFADREFAVTALGPEWIALTRDGTLDDGAASYPVTVRKTLSLGGSRLKPTLSIAVAVESHATGPVRADLVLEWTVNLAGGGGNPAAWYRVPGFGDAASSGGGTGTAMQGAGERLAHDSEGECDDLASLGFGNDDEGVEVTASAAPAARVAWFPVETISNSEAGFERSYQGSALLFRWPLALDPGATFEASVRFGVGSGRDRLVEEMG